MTLFHTALVAVHVIPSKPLCTVYLLDAILNMVNNIAANVLGATPELEGGKESEGTDPSYNLKFPSVTLCHTLIFSQVKASPVDSCYTMYTLIVTDIHFRLNGGGYALVII